MNLHCNKCDDYHHPDVACPLPKTNDKVIYSKLRKKFLEDNPIDVVELKISGKIVPSTVVHHRAGRDGNKLLDISTFIATTRDRNNWIHENPDAAIRLGFLDASCRNTLRSHKRNKKKAI